MEIPVFTIFPLLLIILPLFYFVESRWEGKAHEPSHKLTHHVYLEVQTGDKAKETIVLGMYGDLVPKTVHNFVSFCEGTQVNGKYYSYVDAPFHRIIPNFMIQGGDIINKNGTGSLSVYGETFPDENFTAKHKKHVIAMANRGPNTNGSQFYITTVPTSWLNGHHVVFGEVVDGQYVVQAVEATGTESGVPTATTVVTSCRVTKL